MRVSQRLDYALQALIALAGVPAGVPVAAGELADRLRLPRRFVEQQVTLLAHAGIVSCRRGASGGCVLARDASTITVGDVVRAVQGDALDVPRQQHSAAAEFWGRAKDTLEGFLDSVTIEELAARQRELDEIASPLYYI